MYVYVCINSPVWICIFILLVLTVVLLSRALAFLSRPDNRASSSLFFYSMGLRAMDRVSGLRPLLGPRGVNLETRSRRWSSGLTELPVTLVWWLLLWDILKKTSRRRVSGGIRPKWNLHARPHASSSGVYLEVICIYPFLTTSICQ